MSESKFTGPQGDDASRRAVVLRLAVLAAVGFLTVTSGLVTVGLLPSIAADFAVSESVAGLMTAMYAGVIVVTIVPLMSVTRRVPRRALLVGALFVSVAGNALVAVSQWFALALAGRLLGGVAQGLIWALLAPFVARLVPPSRVGAALAIVFAGNTLGLAVGAPLGGLLGGLLGWREVFVVLSVAAAVLAGSVLLLLPDVRTSSPPSFSVWIALRQPGMPSVMVAGSLLLLANFAMLTYLSPFLIDRGATPPLDSIALSLFGCAGLLGVWLAGRAGTRRPRRTMLSTISAWAVACGLLAFTSWTNGIGLALIAVWGVCTAANSVLNQAAMIRTAGDYTDAATSVMVLVTQGGVALGALYGGAAIDLFDLAKLPAAAAVPLLVVLAVVAASRTAYPPGPPSHSGHAEPH